MLIFHFHYFSNSIHNLAHQKEVANLWHTNESKANVGIWSFTRYTTLKNCDEFQYVLMPCTNIMYVLQCIIETVESELKSSVHWSNHFFLALNNQINKGSHYYIF
jgi:hypothetical protein